VLPFGRLWYDTPDNAIGYAMQGSRSHDAVIRVYDAAGNRCFQIPKTPSAFQLHPFLDGNYEISLTANLCIALSSSTNAASCERL
jgi:hypothetical protein